MTTITANNKIATACELLSVGRVPCAECSGNAISLRFYIKTIEGRPSSGFTHSKSFCVSFLVLLKMSGHHTSNQLSAGLQGSSSP